MFKKFISRVLSHECGPFWQFVKYGAIGVASTLVQMIVFYLLATTILPCLTSDDFAVKFLGLSSANVEDGVRAYHFAIATVGGFLIANIFCWLMNRAFVFRAGRFAWPIELFFFVAVSGLAMIIATIASGWLIHSFGLMTTLAVVIEVFVSFVLNFFIRKFFIFKG